MSQLPPPPPPYTESYESHCGTAASISQDVPEHDRRLFSHYEDQALFLRTLEAFRLYYVTAAHVALRRRDQWGQLPSEHKALLFGHIPPEYSNNHQVTSSSEQRNATNIASAVPVALDDEKFAQQKPFSFNTGGVYPFIIQPIDVSDITMLSQSVTLPLQQQLQQDSAFAILVGPYQSCIDFCFTKPTFDAIRMNQQFLNRAYISAKELFHSYWPDEKLPPYFSSKEFLSVVEEVLEEDRIRSDQFPDIDDVADKERVATAANRSSFWNQYDQNKPESVHNLPPNSLLSTDLDIDKVESTLKQYMRDWSSDGAHERSKVYGPILNAIVNIFPDAQRRRNVSVLVPGAGLSRLSVELAMLGFSVCGNEFSYHMLIGGHYVMNKLRASNEYFITPFIDSTLNLVHRFHHYRTVAIPDLCTIEAAEMLEKQGLRFGDLAMAAGDFVDVYKREKEAGNFVDVISSCFFIDTAHNIIEYLEIMHGILKPGGYLINIGPLLYHFANTLGEFSVELSLDEVISVAEKIGFHVVHHPVLSQTTYTCNPSSMKQVVYNAAFFILQK